MSFRRSHFQENQSCCLAIAKTLKNVRMIDISMILFKYTSARFRPVIVRVLETCLVLLYNQFY